MHSGKLNQKSHITLGVVMKYLVKVIGTTIVVISLGLMGSTHVLAKAHDQGVADGSRAPGKPADPGVPGGVGDNVNKGKRGAAASAAGGDNRGENGSIGGGHGGSGPAR